MSHGQGLPNSDFDLKKQLLNDKKLLILPKEFTENISIEDYIVFFAAFENISYVCIVFRIHFDQKLGC